MIKSRNQYDELRKSQNQNEKGIVFGCSLPFLVFGIAALVLAFLGAKEAPDNWMLLLPLGAGVILSSIGILGFILPYAIRLTRYIYRKIKAKRSTPID
jgi:hypothetical protein